MMKTCVAKGVGVLEELLHLPISSHLFPPLHLLCIGPNIRIGRESWCLPYAGFFKKLLLGGFLLGQFEVSALVYDLFVRDGHC